MTLENYLTRLSKDDQQQLMSQLNINNTDIQTVVHAAHQLYWDHIWPSKLSVSDQDGKKMLSDPKHTGLSLINTVNALDPATVLDIGCGQNFYKNKIKNLVGIDMFGQHCDLQFDYFKSNYDAKADVILIFGPVDYGAPEQVHQNLLRIKQNCRPGTQIFFRFNVSNKFNREIMPGKDISFFMHKTARTPEQWNQEVKRAGFDVLFSDWDMPERQWHIRAVARLIDNPEE